jgi:peptidoglycan/xylan/chitin deacetylase (PgdA/CDA1 family)
MLSLDGRGTEAALTFDDGGSASMVAAEELERRGWHGHFFVTTGRIGTPEFLGEDELRELAARGHVIGSHSHSHPDQMGDLDPEHVLEEWSHSRDELERILGAPPRIASVPGGHLSEAVLGAAARAGYRLLLTSEPSARLRRTGDLTVLGRYAVLSSTSAGRVTGFARGAVWSCAPQLASWRVKSFVKRRSPAAFDAARRVRLRSLER